MPKTNQIDVWHEEVDLPEMLLSLGEDLEREGLLETPNRVYRAWKEFLEGYTLVPEDILEKTFEAEGHGIQICRNIHFTSLCEHHLLAFIGRVDIAYIPNERVVGLSKLARLVDCFAHRLQIQERMVEQIAETLHEAVEARGVFVVAKAVHLCCHGRGIKREGMYFTTSAVRGNVPESLQTTLLTDDVKRL